MKAVIDTNVILDVLQAREPWYKDDKAIFLAIAKGQITGCFTAKQAADIHFFCRKQFVGQENTNEKTRSVLSRLFLLFELLDTLAVDCQSALAVQNNDYEDAMLIETAVRSGADCIVTRNPEHYKVSPVEVYSPAEFAAMISAESDIC